MDRERVMALTRRVLTVLLVAMVAARLAGLIDWSWWVVTAPLWGPILLVVLAIPFEVRRLSRGGQDPTGSDGT